MKTVVKVFFSLLIGLTLYSCDKESENVTDNEGTFQVKLDDRFLSMDSFSMIYSENSNSHKLKIRAYFSDIIDTIVPYESMMKMELEQKIFAGIENYEEGVLRPAIYSTGLGGLLFKCESEMTSDLFETGGFKDFFGETKIKSMDAETEKISGHFNFMSVDSVYLTGNFYDVIFKTVE